MYKTNPAAASLNELLTLLQINRAVFDERFAKTSQELKKAKHLKFVLSDGSDLRNVPTFPLRINCCGSDGSIREDLYRFY